uniref:m7GpppX diphosphatase n=1 Tax=Ditylenchus dipsaci TaxID=166011 RepID=A0A915DUF6_9BILA
MQTVVACKDKSSQVAFSDLTNFTFKEILGGDVARKAIFVHLEHIEEKKPAILICDKHPFVEDGGVIEEWVKGSKLRLLSSNSIYGNYEMLLPEKFNEVKSTFIYPATQNHIEKYRRQDVFMIYETPEDYEKITLQYINESHMSVSWVHNLLDKKAEVDRIILEEEDKSTGFIVAPDLKWNGTDVDNLYLQAIVHRRDIRSVRDLTADELPLLEGIRDKVLQLLKEKWALSKGQVKMYFHYQPSYYHLHIHIINIKYEAPGLTSTSIDLFTVIDNLKLFPDYYKKATLPFVRKRTDALYQKFAEFRHV